MAEIRKKLKRYPTDLTDEEWSLIAPLLPAPARKSRPRKTDLREVVNAIRYLVRTGCGWRRLVRDYEQRIDVSQAMIHIALSSLLIRRIAH
jgi:putative transposase